MTKKYISYAKSFKTPDERRKFLNHGYLDLVTLEDGTSMGRGVFEPGWKWSNDIKPIADTPSCQAEHHGYCISGSMMIHMDNGDEFRIETGNAFYIPPGHDAWVDSKEACQLIDVTGFQKYALKAA